VVKTPSNTKTFIAKAAPFGLTLAMVVIAVTALVGLRKPNELPQPALKDLAAQHNIKLGNHAIKTHLNDKKYVDILTSQFDYVLADNTPNWYFTSGGLRPAPDKYNFKEMDEVVDFAEKHRMPVEAHHYIWGEEKWLPNWLKNGNYNREQLLKIMDDHINTVGQRYSGRIAQWTVVNEAFTRKQHIFGLHDWWADHTGGGYDYIDEAFRTARKADPKSQLLLNDFHTEGYNETSNLMYDYVKGALARGVPIDGIGMQMHIDGTHPPEKDEVIANMKRFADLGLDIYVTEFDVNMNDVQADDGDRDNIQGKIYYEMMRACIESKVCKQFAFLGITDSETWYNYLGLPDARPLLFDRQYYPKPAYFSTRQALEQK
jgi:endo-1,4-beta-xylanase